MFGSPRSTIIKLGVISPSGSFKEVWGFLRTFSARLADWQAEEIFDWNIRSLPTKTTVRRSLGTILLSESCIGALIPGNRLLIEG